MRRSTPCLALIALSLALLLPAVAFAHCDTMDGPVVKAAREALRTRNANFVLIWVQKQDEAEVRHAFRQALAVRRSGGAARELADKYFFETVVRLHRAGEGEPYTGLKPAGTEAAPIIRALDAAVKTGSVEPVLAMLPAEARGDVRERFSQVVALKGFDADDVDAGRRYVKSYVTFIHHVEHLYGERAPGAGHAH
ncbi:MAG TPA: DUF6448 family protein [Pyrinomonadaceae bacterium]